MRQKRARALKTKDRAEVAARAPAVDRLIPEMGFEEGVEEIVKRLSDRKERPLLVAVYGWPNSGKNHLIEKVTERLERSGLVVSGESGGPSPVTFEMLRKYGFYYGDALLFHCSWDRTRPGTNEWRDHEDPNVLAKNVGISINLNIGIYNPRHRKPVMSGEYDLLIRNPDSVINPGSEAEE